MRTRPARLAISAAALATAALSLTACSSGGSSTAASGSTTASQSASSSGSGTTGTSSQPSTSTGTTSGGVNGGATSSGTSSLRTQAGGTSGIVPCATSQLKATQQDASVGAGQYYSKVVFTNVSGTTCTLDGFPGVSYVKQAGVQSGNAAQRSGGPGHVVTLKPHGTASAVLHDANGIGGYDPSQCQLSQAQGLRVYPPNQKAALFIPWNTQHCAGPTIHSLTIGPVQAG
ncbi:DUF4232 domain-containing protein [Streptomyces sp. PTM05]|uniref:DUF4232 domain-containing protein n=1 Tax=Streptantibioticus parmotrematis TaxID=2873249 RepID=A0ABS7R3F1_9ACTN|nr:DUF4232 domain-containing protein [Streptantibioticus parmotrematis]MBY8888569.1 DUF4232 domain-containing protein [Streptantibioticus parmotrematis]